MQDEQMHPIFWVGDSKKRLLEFPTDVRRKIGYAREKAQGGETPDKTKPLRGFSGVYEIEIVVRGKPAAEINISMPFYEI